MVTKKPKGLGRGLDALLGPATQASDAATPAGTPMMLALDQRMPEFGWRLIADALASFQISLLADAAGAGELAQEGTQQLFAALRHFIDRGRGKGRYLLLGSATPSLVRGVSESLAGRVAIVELTPFLL